MKLKFATDDSVPSFRVLSVSKS